MRVRALLDAGCDVTLTDNYWQTPLHLASAQGHVMVMGMLIT